MKEQIFTICFLKVLAALLSVLIGYLAGRFSKVEKESIAALLFYFIAPIVFFAIPTSSSLKFSDLGITLITYIIASSLGFIAYFIYGKMWQDGHRNILALSAGTGNSAYLVLPIASSIFDDATLSIYALALIGISIYEVSIGCYFCARTFSTAKESFMRVARLPILNAFFIGCALSLSGFQLPDFLDEFAINMKSAFSILGMIMIGLALAKIREFKLDLKFTSAAFTSKFILFPVAINIFIWLDYFVLGLYDNNYYNALQLLSLAPLSTNTIVIASLYKIHPEKMASSVLFSLLFVLLYLPTMAIIMLRDVPLAA